MLFKISLIKIVNNPVNKNCWLAVEQHSELKASYIDCITFYDFIDYEGDVFYYDVVEFIETRFNVEIDTQIILENKEINSVKNKVSLNELSKFNQFLENIDFSNHVVLIKKSY